jgi:hypothetical protein
MQHHGFHTQFRLPMKERPILFSAPMVRALLSGTKTQTRRAVRKQFAPDALVAEVGATTPEGWQVSGHSGLWWDDAGACLEDAVRCPYGMPGDRLWVRETFAKIDGQTQPWIETDYRATYTHGDRLGDSLGIKKRWTPAIHMPRAASRITLEVTGVRVERLQDISEADAIAEGVGDQPRLAGYSPKAGCQWEPQDPRDLYAQLWEQINGPGSWEVNPWVWVIQFKRLEGGTA